MNDTQRTPSDGLDGPLGGVPAVASEPEESWGDLLAASARGDETAFARLYDASAARVFGLVLRVVRDRAQAEEVTQEVYHRLWLESARFDPRRGSAISWVMTLAHRRAVDRVRAAEAARTRETAYESQNRTTPFDSTSELVGDRLEAARVRRALDGLTERQREAIELAFFGGYTHTEVAAILGLPVGTAKTRIRDGLIRLRDTLGLDR